jgi:hypothetical protein
MRPGMKRIPRTVIALLFFLTAALLMADEATTNILSTILDDFDQPAKSLWIVQGSKYVTSGFPQLSFLKTWPDALYGKNKDNKDLYVLGLHGKFDRQAYNYVEIIPAAKDSSGKLVPNAIPIPGRAKSLDMWVWGSNYDYYLEVHLRDFQGVDHVLNFGSIKFAGWQNMSVEIPAAIPQAASHIPRFKGLEITEFVLWTRPTEKVDDFYFFIDQIKVLTDMFESRFDGDNLADVDTLNQLWTAGAQTGR